MSETLDRTAGAPSALPVLRSAPVPIVIIGAGGIVHDAHLPAYCKGGLPVAAVVDRDPARAAMIAQQFGVPLGVSELAEARIEGPVIFDLAVPAKHLLSALATLPDGAAVLMH